ncbi:sensor histidine kinase [Herbidospora mongoliensis]|uniref:sensor histidine kinase n=1 Tax=Herbidospora mongoliensis TaxID=688067 RepID=UPI000A86CA87|nr:HAMP domain-containing sensor histidine kinase [Herbidospora mongoliensis]
MGRQPPSFRARRTFATGVLMVLMCLGLSFLFLMYVGGKESDNALQKGLSAWNTVESLIQRGQLPSVLPQADDEAVQVLNAHGTVVAASSQLAGEPPLATFRPTADKLSTTQILCHPAGMEGCRTVTSINVYQPDGIWSVYVATPTVPWYGNSTAVLLAIGTSLLVITAVTAWVFRDISKAVEPVVAIRRQLADITAAQLERRVPVPGTYDTYDEVKVLAETVNGTLDRLEGAYERLRRFTSDASHDLRSPITAMRLQLDDALAFPQDADWPTVAATVLKGVDRLQAIVTDLLALARLDAGAPLSGEPTDLGVLAGAELDQRPHRAKIVRRLQQGVCVDCDRLRISRVLVNLLDNAERHATSQITVTVRAENGIAVLEVLDDGAGLAAEDRERVFERFTRLDAARDRDAGGTGLGLAIAREIAQAHEGTLTVEDSDRGARFVLRLPQCGNTVPATREVFHQTVTGPAGSPSPGRWLGRVTAIVTRDRRPVTTGGSNRTEAW